MNRPAPVEVSYRNMRFLITHNPTDATLSTFVEVSGAGWVADRGLGSLVSGEGMGSCPCPILSVCSWTQVPVTGSWMGHMEMFERLGSGESHGPVGSLGPA